VLATFSSHGGDDFTFPVVFANGTSAKIHLCACRGSGFSAEFLDPIPESIQGRPYYFYTAENIPFHGYSYTGAVTNAIRFLEHREFLHGIISADTSRNQVLPIMEEDIKQQQYSGGPEFIFGLNHIYYHE